MREELRHLHLHLQVFDDMMLVDSQDGGPSKLVVDQVKCPCEAKDENMERYLRKVKEKKFKDVGFQTWKFGNAT